MISPSPSSKSTSGDEPSDGKILSTKEIILDMFTIKFENFHRLFSREDGKFMHSHKIIGLLCLIHFVYRGYLLVKTGSMQFDGSYFTLFTIVLHAVLSCSSMIFHIPETRIRGAPMIYPEFRLHSILFACRSLACMTLMWLTLRLNSSSPSSLSSSPPSALSPLLLRGPLVLLTMFLADWITRAHRQQGSTMRAMPVPAHFSAEARALLDRFYATSQLFATAQVLFAPRMDELFLVLLPVQLAALLMTLVRKSLLSAAGWHALYALALGSNYVAAPYGSWLKPVPRQAGLMIPSAVAVAVLRFNFPSISKYALWGGVVILHLVAMIAWGKYTVIAV